MAVAISPLPHRESGDFLETYPADSLRHSGFLRIILILAAKLV
jgi:hypothetical protein